MPAPISRHDVGGRWRPFHCEARRTAGELRLLLDGEFDLESSPTVRAMLGEHLDEEVRRLVLDLRDVTFMDSSGLRTVVEAGRAAMGRGIGFAVAPGPPNVQRIFDMTGTAGLFPAA